MTKCDVRLLVAAGGILLIAMLHVLALFVGPEAFDYLDAPELAEQLRRGEHLVPTALTLFVVVALLVFATYALSGAGLVRRLPKLRVVLLAMAGIFTLRGVGVVWFIYLSVSDSPNAIPREIGFSLVALALGVLLLLGGLNVQKPPKVPSHASE